jgi:cyclohexadienyl dehydratase
MKIYARHFLVLSVFVLFCALDVHGQSTATPDAVSRFQQIQKAGILRVGIPGDYAPFAISRADSLYGADIKMARKLAAALGVRPQYVQTSWPNLTTDMRNDAFDIALGGISITPERSAVASFSISYHAGGKTFLCRRADSARFSIKDSVNNPRVHLIVNKGGTNEAAARALFPAATLIVYPDNIGVFNEIIAGRADVMVTDDTEADLKVHQYPPLCRSFPGTLTKNDKAIWVHTDTTLLNFVNSWLQKELAMGEPQKWLNEAMNGAK